ncbi:GNAT family N-acetyltransferase [Pseudomonas sp. sp1636]|uniref:GNAT family N-acetyltransferase n=1 Tax=Pseudomonas sp. sp1636 TaxID=3036707 RepID=UPI0025A5D1F3|nr:GNAT family N-acetyltransferase [Pseudomonas sp. sp1636]MDM8349409.1 GNAT family N-acetyltransferase [Pseudomonas sp. sp1636]
MHDLHYRALPAPLQPLVDAFYRAHRSPIRADRQAQVWVAQHSAIVAALCLRPMAQGYWLSGLFVAPSQRRQGLARQLIERALAHTSEPVWLFCHPELTRFYENLGFIPCTDLPTALAERLSRYQRKRNLISLCR